MSDEETDPRPTVPSTREPPDILSPEQRALLEIDPSAPRWALHLLARFEELKANVPDPGATERNLSQLFLLIEKLVYGFAVHQKQTQDAFEDHEKRLNRQRSDIDDTTDIWAKHHRKLITLDKVLHDHDKTLYKHGRSLTELEERINKLTGSPHELQHSLSESLADGTASTPPEKPGEPGQP